jgi:predicted PurR-regulated permease PerM
MSASADSSPSRPSGAGPGRFVRRVITAISVVLIALFVLAAVWLATEVVLTIIAGMLGAVLLDGVARVISKHTPLGRRLALSLLLLVGLALAIGFGLWAAPDLARQLDGLGTRITEALQQLRVRAADYRWADWALSNIEPKEVFSGNQAIVGQVGGAVFAAVGVVGTLLLAIVFAIYFAFQPGIYLDGALYLAPPEGRDRLREVMAEIGHALRRWFVGRFVSMLAVGVGTGLGLWAAGVPMPFVLGILAGALSFVPNLGPLLSAAPGLLLAWTQSTATMLWALGVYVGVQLVDNYAITPLVELRAVKLPPALLLGVQLLLGVLAGALGLLLATPLTVAVIVAVQMLYVRDVLGDRVEPLAHGTA